MVKCVDLECWFDFIVGMFVMVECGGVECIMGVSVVMLIGLVYCCFVVLVVVVEVEVVVWCRLGFECWLGVEFDVFYGNL